MIREANYILKSDGSFGGPAAGIKPRYLYAWIAKSRGESSVSLCCAVLLVRREGYYDWRKWLNCKYSDAPQPVSWLMLSDASSIETLQSQSQYCKPDKTHLLHPALRAGQIVHGCSCALPLIALKIPAM